MLDGQLADLYFFSELQNTLGANQALAWMKMQALGSAGVSVHSTRTHSQSSSMCSSPRAHNFFSPVLSYVPAQQPPKTGTTHGDLEADQIRERMAREGGGENVGLLYTDAAHLLREAS
mmetsp:Transcript_28666/g.42096  ORF Transcript_28666/g.42096 Transcript_28666/m.42096 type:complete len:118 (-) Transcript_28666:89-442(-)